MKSATFAFVLLAVAGISSFASAYERELEEQNERRLGSGGKWSRKTPSQRLEKYMGINERCCLPEDFNSLRESCKCRFRTVNWFGIKAKWDRQCRQGGTIFEETTVAKIGAVNSDMFSTLTSLLEKSGLVDTLNREGTFTVFAPTNDAFAALPEDTLKAVTADTDEGRALLKKVLLYHVLETVVLAEDLPAGGTVSPETLFEKQTFTIDTTNDPPTISSDAVNDAEIVKSDVRGSNGVIHVIDQVLVPNLN